MDVYRVEYPNRAMALAFGSDVLAVPGSAIPYEGEQLLVMVPAGRDFVGTRLGSAANWIDALALDK